MREEWTVVAVVLLAVLVGCAVPVLFQLYSTLRATRILLRRLGPKLDSTLTELRETSHRLNRAGSGLEDSARRARLMLDTAGDLGELMKGLRQSIKAASAIGSAVGPALAAAVSALTSTMSHGNPPSQTDENEAEPEGDASPASGGGDPS